MKINLAPTFKLVLASILCVFTWPVETLFPSTRGCVVRWFGWDGGHK